MKVQIYTVILIALTVLFIALEKKDKDRIILLLAMLLYLPLWGRILNWW